MNLRDYLITNHNARKSPVLTDPDELTMDCPFCGKGKNHFNFNIRTKKGGCLKCGSGTDDVYLLSLLEHIKKKDAKILLQYGDLSGDKISATLKILTTNTAHEQPVEEILHKNSELPRKFELMIDSLRNPVRLIPDVFAKRNYPDSTIKDFKLGFCRDGDYASRIIFPVYCKDMKSFVARRVFDWQNKKYKNPPESKHSQLIYGYNLIPKQSIIFIVEGPTDVLRLYSWGFYGAGMFGKKISNQQIDLIFELEPEEVVCVFDGDALEQNQKAFNKIALRLNCSYMELPEKNNNEYYDPDDISKDLFIECYENRMFAFKKMDNMLRILKN